MAPARIHPEGHVIAGWLCYFYNWCAASGLPDLERRASAVETW
ncbi:hypothetical protein [Planomonospora parontospora]|nr:hypothetical protein [Planomonospora parontospora]